MAAIVAVIPIRRKTVMQKSVCFGVRKHARIPIPVVGPIPFDGPAPFGEAIRFDGPIRVGALLARGWSARLGWGGGTEGALVVALSEECTMIGSMVRLERKRDVW
ncbi:hypothetical protein EJ06DRAFT_532364 [Trichodelitschia bisporula]|uniref:Uncharacterized protein n=1 Tax=Trichodelitschia bisporula TaxID=703511 RepID=A0A6G1HQ23_9PEZI|nr:hypothetical protein EJ06DRAFT_532364 [Trichodelitschia bisporula]